MGFSEQPKTKPSTKTEKSRFFFSYGQVFFFSFSVFCSLRSPPTKKKKNDKVVVSVNVHHRHQRRREKIIIIFVLFCFLNVQSVDQTGHQAVKARKIKIFFFCCFETKVCLHAVLVFALLFCSFVRFWC